ncbi:hypothetical protein CMQ_6704 [Grosmannia clavigera kw1407]|uniref:ORC6 first cyclin-like domain-containing protein n=1 Tax=Grosmannia clavigera (strain kw1407 / UAMH 11150) TaxID=655863 RepID=F0X6S6_GROCL|nr:uncharacterized protein CMQ_6704 [Grosmannia clavigera kw1407]EFX06383.1 hypothetical protein CMQ_6704 [Grosmannia clavigera kw1407]
MNRSTDQSLQSLLPTHNGTFSPQLTDLAGSLLAQSRHRVSTLKADEEVARPYACAHIACDRLKTVLNLPPIEPRPPIQPRLYKRLYAHLNTVLQPTPAQRDNQTPRKDGPQRDVAVGTPFRTATPKRRPARTPRPTAKGSTTIYSPQKRPGGPASVSVLVSVPPPWLRPTVRFVCSTLGHARLAPTVAAGLSAILREAAEQSKKTASSGVDDGETEPGSPAWVAGSLTALAATLYYYCIKSWQASQDVGPMDKTQYNTDERTIMDVFQKAREGGVQLEGGAGDVWEKTGWHDLTRHSFREALLAVSDRKWLESDWFRDIQQLRDVAGSDYSEGGDSNDNNNDDDDDDDAAIPTHTWRSDSMFQERYDLLSETRRQDYGDWKKEMLQRLREGTRTGGE